MGLPAQVVEIQKNENGEIVGKVSFPTSTLQVSLSFLPDVRIGDYVMVHYGFATERIAPEEADAIIKLQNELQAFLSETNLREDLSDSNYSNPG